MPASPAGFFCSIAAETELKRVSALHGIGQFDPLDARDRLALEFRALIERYRDVDAEPAPVIAVEARHVVDDDHTPNPAGSTAFRRR